MQRVNMLSVYSLQMVATLNMSNLNCQIGIFFLLFCSLHLLRKISCLRIMMSYLENCYVNKSIYLLLIISTQSNRSANQAFADLRR